METIELVNAALATQDRRINELEKAFQRMQKIVARAFKEAGFDLSKAIKVQESLDNELPEADKERIYDQAAQAALLHAAEPAILEPELPGLEVVGLRANSLMDRMLLQAEIEAQKELTGRALIDSVSNKGRTQ